MKVFVVEQGEYSRRHVVGIFSNAELAKEFTNGLDGECDVSTETWELDKTKGMEIKKPFLATIELSDGRVTEYPYLEDQSELVAKGAVASGIVIFYNQRAEVRSYISREHAVKLVVEARQKWLRENQ